MTIFVLTMCLHPHVLDRAQEELDRAVGRDRMPTFDDWEHLPYIHAIIKEIFRWMPVVPFGMYTGSR